MRGFAVILPPIAVLLVSCHPAAAPVSISNRPASVNDVRVGKPLKEMSWTGMDGKESSLSDLEGKVVILDFWATYCDPCKDEIPHLNSLQAKYGSENLKIIGLNAGGSEDRPKIAHFRRQTAIDYDLAFPDDDLVTFVFAGDDSIPQTMVIDRKGRIVKKIVGFNDRIKQELDAAVQTAMVTE